MLASYEWLRELSGIDAPPDEVADRLTAAGLEVEGIEHRGEGLDDVVIAEVRGIRPHPKADKLRLVTVFDGESEQEVVCGAPNVPDPGGRVLFARLGAELPAGFTIEERSIRGVVSKGMICSEHELGIGEGSEGIFVLAEDDPAKPGVPIAEALGLRDTIYEIGLTPNRPDCLGHVGLARELCALYGRRFTLPEVEPPRQTAKSDDALLAGGQPIQGLAVHFAEDLPAPDHVDPNGLGPVGITIEEKDAHRCPRYGAALVLGVKVGPSPFWLRYRLHCLGLRSISNLVDATNLMMLEHGHPIHGFDLERLFGRVIVVRTAREGERMTTLDGVERELGTDDLLVCDGRGPVAVAGVMGGEESEIGGSTRNVLIECAYFEPRSVRRTSRRLGMHTDASHRFERGVDPLAVPRVLARSASLIADLGGGAMVTEFLNRVAKPTRPRKVVLRPERMSALLGLTVADEEIERILRGIGAEPERREDGAFEISAPTHRPDIGREADLVEEVARIHGYDKIPTRVPKVRPSSEGTPPRIHFRASLKAAAAASGLYEAVAYSFCSPEDLARTRSPEDAVPLENPLSEERSVMRTSLLPGLLDAVGHARRRGVQMVALFELGRTFHPHPETLLPLERDQMAFALSGGISDWIGAERPADFFDAKGRLEAIVEAVSGAPPTVEVSEELAELAPFLHPRRRAVISLAGRRIGAIGEIHPDVVDASDVPGRVVYAEVDVALLYDVVAAMGEPKAPVLPRFPAVTRDISIVVDEAHPMAAIRDALLAEAGALAERVELFDLYRGEHVPRGKKSLAFRVTYRDPDGTLTDKKVDKTHHKLAKAATNLFDAAIR